MKNLLTCFFFIFICTFSLFSQIDWTQLDGPSGTGIGVVIALEDGIILAGSSAASTFEGTGLYRSSDNGASWIKISDGIPEDAIVNGISYLGGAVYCAVENQELFKSTDKGLTWIQTEGLSTNTTSQAMTSNGYLYSFGFVNAVRSTDGGNTWEAMSGISEDHISEAWGCAVDSKDNLYILPNNKGVYKSSDFGVTWAKLSNGLTDMNCRAIYIDSDDNLFVGTWTAGIFVSTDEGESFALKSTGLPTGNSHPKVKRFSENKTTKTIYASLPFNGIYQTSDMGENWVNGSENLNFTWANDVCIAPDNKIWVATEVGGLFGSSDDGDTWEQAKIKGALKGIYEFYETNDAIYTATGDGGIYKSTNHGDEWDTFLEPYTMPQSFILAFIILPNGNYLYSRNQNGFFLISSNNSTEKKFTEFGNDLPETFLLNNNLLYAGFRASGIYISSDEGETWTKEEGAIENKSIYSMAVNSNGDIFAGTNRQGFFRKKSAGEWEKLSLDENLFFGATAVNSAGELFVGVAEGGIYKSTDDGDTFTKINDEIDAISMAISSDNQIFVGTNSDTYYSPDNGVTWQHPTEGYHGGYSRTLAIDKDSYVYVGTMNGGINRTKITITALQDTEYNSGAITLFPNPAKGKMSFSTDLNDFHVSIFDVLGNRISKTHVENGSNHSLDLSDLQTGVYNLILEKDGKMINSTKFVNVLE